MSWHEKAWLGTGQLEQRWAPLRTWVTKTHCAGVAQKTSPWQQLWELTNAGQHLKSDFLSAFHLHALCSAFLLASAFLSVPVNRFSPVLFRWIHLAGWMTHPVFLFPSVNFLFPFLSLSFSFVSGSLCKCDWLFIQQPLHVISFEIACPFVRYSISSIVFSKKSHSDYPALFL